MNKHRSFFIVLLASATLVACGDRKEFPGDENATETAGVQTNAAPPAPPLPPPRPKFVPSTQFSVLSTGNGVMPSDFESIDAVEFFKQFENVSKTIQKEPYETNDEYESRKSDSFRKAIAPVELGVEYPFEVMIVRWEYDAERELLTLGLPYADAGSMSILNLPSSKKDRVRAFDIGRWEVHGGGKPPEEHNLHLAVPRATPFFKAFKPRTLDYLTTYSFTVPLSRDAARSMLSKDDTSPFGAVIVASIEAEVPAVDVIEMSGGQWLSLNHTLFGRVSRVVFYSRRTREIIRSFPEDASN
jgi:hypothetical protein